MAILILRSKKVHPSIIKVIHTNPGGLIKFTCSNDDLCNLNIYLLFKFHLSFVLALVINTSDLKKTSRKGCGSVDGGKRGDNNQ